MFAMLHLQDKHQTFCGGVHAGQHVQQQFLHLFQYYPKPKRYIFLKLYD